MGIANRDKDASEQNYVVEKTFGAVPVSTAGWIGGVPSPGQILEWKFTGKGLSGAPAYQLSISRWTSGGVTSIALGSAVTLPIAFGTSGGMLGATFASNSSLAAVQAGDVLVVNSTGANTAVTDLIVSVVIKATQDIKKTFDI